MAERLPTKLLIISDFNPDNLAMLLKNDDSLPQIEPVTAPYGQVLRVLLEGDMECWQASPDSCLVFTRPESVIGSFKRLRDGELVSTDDLLMEVDSYCSALESASQRASILFVCTWTNDPLKRAYSLLDMKTGMGQGNALLRMNLRLCENLEDVSNVHILDTRRWISRVGASAFSEKRWYMAKVPYANPLFKEAVEEIKSALRCLAGESIKLIALDLDDTLWGGIVGDIGWENITLGGHDHIGEAYVDFQRELKSLKKKGLLLVVVSKNEQSVALEAIENHPEMVLRKDDFVGWRINWEDKARNLAELVEELNLGFQSVLFIDDNPAERARVKDTLPEVVVPDWPVDKTLSRQALLSLSCLNAVSVSDEDQHRTDMYQLEAKRRGIKASVSSFEDWLKDLGMTARVAELGKADIQRTTQLLNKTNQMNLSTRRMTESELLNWSYPDNRICWTFRVSDKFGDSGLTGIVSLELQDRVARMVDFVLSCRVMGRKVEETMLYVAVEYAREMGCEEVRAEYVETSKNKPCLDFWERSGLHLQDDNLFVWPTASLYPSPDGIVLLGM